MLDRCRDKGCVVRRTGVGEATETDGTAIGASRRCFIAPDQSILAFRRIEEVLRHVS